MNEPGGRNSGDKEEPVRVTATSETHSPLEGPRYIISRRLWGVVGIIWGGAQLLSVPLAYYSPRPEPDQIRAIPYRIGVGLVLLLLGLAQFFFGDRKRE